MVSKNNRCRDHPIILVFPIQYKKKSLIEGTVRRVSSCRTTVVGPRVTSKKCRTTSIQNTDRLRLRLMPSIKSFWENNKIKSKCDNQKFLPAVRTYPLADYSMSRLSSEKFAKRVRDITATQKVFVAEIENMFTVLKVNFFE